MPAAVRPSSPIARRASRLLGALAGAAIVAGLASPPAGAAAVKITKARASSVEAPAGTSADRVYDVDGADATAYCGTQGTPIMVGWTGLRSPVDEVRVRADGNYASVETRKAMTATRVRASALCARGPLRASVVTPDGTTASCGAKLALGIPVRTSWPYAESAVAVRADGTRRWRVTGPVGWRAAAVCVSARAFKRVTTRSATASFRPGQVESTVAATCPSGRRPIAWGHEADPAIGNLWQSSESRDTRLSVPFISAAQASGARGWRLTFRTPDQQPAVAGSRIAVHLTCATPR